MQNLGPSSSGIVHKALCKYCLLQYLWSKRTISPAEVLARVESRVWFHFNVNNIYLLMGSLHRSTGPGWKAKLFLFLMRNLFFKTKVDSFYPGLVKPPSGWWLPKKTVILKTHRELVCNLKQKNAFIFTKQRDVCWSVEHRHLRKSSVDLLKRDFAWRNSTWSA